MLHAHKESYCLQTYSKIALKYADLFTAHTIFKQLHVTIGNYNALNRPTMFGTLTLDEWSVPLDTGNGCGHLPACRLTLTAPCSCII